MKHKQLKVQQRKLEDREKDDGFQKTLRIHCTDFRFPQMANCLYWFNSERVFFKNWLIEVKLSINSRIRKKNQMACNSSLVSRVDKKSKFPSNKSAKVIVTASSCTQEKTPPLLFSCPLSNQKQKSIVSHRSNRAF